MRAGLLDERSEVQALARAEIFIEISVPCAVFAHFWAAVEYWITHGAWLCPP